MAGKGWNKDTAFSRAYCPICNKMTVEIELNSVQEDSMKISINTSALCCSEECKETYLEKLGRHHSAFIINGKIHHVVHKIGLS